MKIITAIILILSINYAQDIEDLFSKNNVGNDSNGMKLNQDIDLTNLENLTYTPVEGPIDPDTYILGPGDLLGVNIISTKNITLSIRVNPVGEIMIPAVGVLNVNGKTLTVVRKEINDFVIQMALRNAVVNTTLLDIRKFKIQVLGAVQNPGFIYVSPIDKVYDAIIQSGGIQKYAHSDVVQIIRNENKISINLMNYLSGNDLTQNVELRPGDIVYVPYSDYANSKGLTAVGLNNHQVVVYGFVNRSGGSNSFQYFPGYSARDYIAMAGGTKEQGASFKSGNINRTMVYRSDGSKIKNAIDEIIQPGDMIEVPPSALYQLVGGDGIIRTLTTLASIASSVYIIDSITNK